MFAFRRRWVAIAALVLPALALLLMGMSLNRTAQTQATTQATTAEGIVALPGYSVSLFAGGTAAYSHPDSVAVDEDTDRVYIGYQNKTLPDGSDHGTSTIVEYNLAGAVIHTFAVPGHCDGLRVNPATHLVWATSNEDANAVLTTINPSTGAEKVYAFPSPAPHGGGYDDVVFYNGTAFIAASNPTLNSAGINTAPAVDTIALSGGSIVLTPVLMGNATALDTTTNTKVTLNLIDPDSMTIDSSGDVVLDNQAGAQLVFLHNAGTAQQTVTTIPLGTQVDDSVWVTNLRSGEPHEGSLIVVDSTLDAIYLLKSNSFVAGTVYTEAPSDSGVASFVGTINLSSGTITPIAIGFASPTGLWFLPD